MFDKYTRNYTTITHNSPSKIDIHEHKAPTDESIKLYSEIYNKALNNIIFHESVIEDNNFKYNIDVIDLMPCTDSTAGLNCRKLVVCTAKVNNKEYIVKKYLNELGIDPISNYKHFIETGNFFTKDEILKVRIQCLSELFAKILVNNDVDSTLYTAMSTPLY